PPNPPALLPPGWRRVAGFLPTPVVPRVHDGPIGQLARTPMSERWPMPRREPLPPPRRLEPALVRNAAQRHHHAHSSQQAQLGGQIRTAALELDAARLVAGRRAPRGRGDIAVVERQAVVARQRLRLAREAMAIPRLVQPR